MKKIAFAALLSAFVAAPAVAADLPIYAGITAGSSTLGSASGTAMGALVGYKLDKSLTKFMGKGSLAVEAHYTMLGEGTTSATSAVTTFFGTQTTTTTISSKYSSMGVNAVASYPIPSVDKLSAFVKLGFASTSGKYTSTTTSTGIFNLAPVTSSGSSSTSGVVYGAGAQYDVTSKIAVRAGYQTYASDVSTIYAAAVYSF